MGVGIDHQTSCFLHEEERGPDIDREHVVEEFFRCIEKVPAVGNGSNIDKDVNDTKSFAGCVHHVAALIDMGKISLDIGTIGAELIGNSLDDCVAIGNVATADDEVGEPFGSELMHDGLAEALGSTGYDRCLVSETHSLFLSTG